jgi:hypothetical protein
MPSLPVTPKLAARVAVTSSSTIELVLDDVEYEVEHPAPDRLVTLLHRLDGRTELPELVSASGLTEDEVRLALTQLDEGGFLDDVSTPTATAAIDVMFELEDQLNQLFAEQVEAGRFWQALTGDLAEVDEDVFYGMAIENWHFLYREGLFDSAVLTFPNSRQVREQLNEFYLEEHRHDDIVLRAFAPLGISPDDMRKARPLPSTMALVNALAWWARTDPLFFLATISTLEGGLTSGGDSDSFIEACERKGLPADFIRPLREHAKINSGHEHGQVSREIMALMPPVSATSRARLRGQAVLFMELYRNFYDGILDYYSAPGHRLLRKVPSVETVEGDQL